MPLEGHWRRQQTPIGRIGTRERRALAGVVVLLAAAAVGVTLYLVLGGSSAPAPARGCVRVTAASTTGGAPVEACGRAAERLCRRAAVEATPLGRALRAACRQARVPAASGADEAPGSGTP